MLPLVLLIGIMLPVVVVILFVTFITPSKTVTITEERIQNTTSYDFVLLSILRLDIWNSLTPKDFSPPSSKMIVIQRRYQPRHPLDLLMESNPSPTPLLLNTKPNTTWRGTRRQSMLCTPRVFKSLHPTWRPLPPLFPIVPLGISPTQRTIRYRGRRSPLSYRKLCGVIWWSSTRTRSLLIPSSASLIRPMESMPFLVQQVLRLLEMKMLIWCGKTSILKALRGRLNRAKGFEINGVIFLNGKLLKREEVGRYIGYVNNRDKLCKYLTVRETLEQALYISEPTTVYIKKERKGKEIGTMNRSSRVWIICWMN